MPQLSSRVLKARTRPLLSSRSRRGAKRPFTLVSSVMAATDPSTGSATSAWCVMTMTCAPAVKARESMSTTTCSPSPILGPTTPGGPPLPGGVASSSAPGLVAVVVGHSVVGEGAVIGDVVVVVVVDTLATLPGLHLSLLLGGKALEGEELVARATHVVVVVVPLLRRKGVERRAKSRWKQSRNQMKRSAEAFSMVWGKQSLTSCSHLE